MADNVLYFPYSRVPQSDWFTRMLLYWDKVGTIVPYEFFEEPERLGPYTQALLQRGLVEAISPGMYVHSIPGFGDAFQQYLHSLGRHLEERRGDFGRGEVTHLHMEKLGEVERVLQDAGLLRRLGYPWFEVESTTALEFMCYLSLTLGRLEEVNAIPVTDQEETLAPFVRSGSEEIDHDPRLTRLRLEVLSEVFPAPRRPLTPDQIEDFKLRYGHLLRAFRRAVEREVLQLAAIADAGFRARRLEILREELNDQVTEIEARLREARFGEVVLGRFCSLVAAIPGASFTFGLANAVYEAFCQHPHEAAPSPLAYAAYAHVELLRPRTRRDP